MSVKNNLYPHLLPDDIELWEQFLADHRDRYQHFDYDVRVGEGRDPGPDMDETIRQAGIGLSQRRIDVVGHLVNALHIIEITLHAGLKAVGQLQVYPQLYQATYPNLLPLRRVLIARDVSPDIREYISQNGILVFEYPKPL